MPWIEMKGHQGKLQGLFVRGRGAERGRGGGRGYEIVDVIAVNTGVCAQFLALGHSSSGRHRTPYSVPIKPKEGGGERADFSESRA